jgi:hypothetical protein
VDSVLPAARRRGRNPADSGPDLVQHKVRVHRNLT